MQMVSIERMDLEGPGAGERNVGETEFGKAGVQPPGVGSRRAGGRAGGAAWRRWPLGASMAAVAACALALTACRAASEGTVGVTVEKDIPGVGKVRAGFEQDWRIGIEAEGYCGCVWFLGPDGHPLEGAPVGRIQDSRGAGVVPRGAVGWRAVIHNEDCDQVDCEEGDHSLSPMEALHSLYPGSGPRRPHVVVGSRLLDEDGRVRRSDLGDWEQAGFLDVAATVDAPDAETAAVLLELHLEAGPFITLPPSERAALAGAVTVHEALTLDLDGPPDAPEGLVGTFHSDEGPCGVQVTCNGAAAAAGVVDLGTAVGGPAAFAFEIPRGLLDADPTFRRSMTNELRLRCKRPGLPDRSTGLKLTFDPLDGR